ncbi:MAG: hypothetical protein FJ134_13290 [Deltaproteobacteria bacterium]|nr:hypothetical protein [Deltaproteobacteria bacterium]
MLYLQILWLLALGGFLGGCAPAISPQVQQQAVPAINLADLQANTEKFQGRTVILGGEIMTVKPYKEGSLLWVDQRPLDPQNRPLRDAASGGSFAVASDQWLPSYLYVPKRGVTVAGVVEGKINGSPLLKAREINLGEYEPWKEWYEPIPPSWYDYDPAMRHWYTPPYFDPWRPGRQ